MSAERRPDAGTRRPAAVTTCHCAVANTGAGPGAAVVALEALASAVVAPALLAVERCR